jgi:hypothetical protein
MNHQLSAGRKLGLDATNKLPGEGLKSHGCRSTSRRKPNRNLP